MFKVYADCYKSKADFLGAAATSGLSVLKIGVDFNSSLTGVFIERDSTETPPPGSLFLSFLENKSTNDFLASTGVVGAAVTGSLFFDFRFFFTSVAGFFSL